MEVPPFLDVLHKRYAVFNEKDHIQKMSEKLFSVIHNNIVFKDDFSQIEKDFQRLNKGLGPKILSLKNLKIASVEEVHLKDIYWILYPVSVVRKAFINREVYDFLEDLKNLKKAENHAFFFRKRQRIIRFSLDLLKNFLEHVMICKFYKEYQLIFWCQ